MQFNVNGEIVEVIQIIADDGSLQLLIAFVTVVIADAIKLRK